MRSQLGIISDSLHLAEGDLENFKLVNRFLDLSREGGLVQSKLEKIDAERTALLLQKSYYEYLKEYVDSKRETGDIVAPSVMGVTDQTLTRTCCRIVKVSAEKKQLAMNLNESLEPLKLVESNIVTVRHGSQRKYH